MSVYFVLTCLIHARTTGQSMDMTRRKENQTMKKTSLAQKVKTAERRERDAKRRMYEKDKEMRRSNAIADGAMLWVAALASKLGPVVHITAEEFKQAKGLTYLAKKNEDGSMDMRQEGYEEEGAMDWE